MLLMIDNYDSFTYNLVQYLGELGADVRVVRNHQVTLRAIAEMNRERIVISPGPCTPNEAGIPVEVIKRFGTSKPILGVCLGHQCIGQAYGGHSSIPGTTYSGRGLSALRGRPSPICPAEKRIRLEETRNEF